MSECLAVLNHCGKGTRQEEIRADNRFRRHEVVHVTSNANCQALASITLAKIYVSISKINSDFTILTYILTRFPFQTLMDLSFRLDLQYFHDYATKPCLTVPVSRCPLEEKLGRMYLPVFMSVNFPHSKISFLVPTNARTRGRT